VCAAARVESERERERERERKEDAPIEKTERPDRSGLLLEHFSGLPASCRGVCSRETHNRQSEKSDGRSHAVGFHGARGPRTRMKIHERLKSKAVDIHIQKMASLTLNGAPLRAATNQYRREGENARALRDIASWHATTGSDRPLSSVISSRIIRKGCATLRLHDDIEAFILSHTALRRRAGGLPRLERLLRPNVFLLGFCSVHPGSRTSSSLSLSLSLKCV
jgi:hypothetical protein